MIKAKQRKDGKWRASVYIGKNEFEKKIYKDIYGATEKECNEKLIDFLYKLNNNLIEKPKVEINTFEELYDKWLENRIDIKEVTREEYDSVKRCHLTPLLKLKTNKITNNVILSFYKDLFDKKGSGVVKKVAGKLNKFLREMALKPSIPIPRDVLDGFKLPKHKKYKPYTVSDKDFKKIITELEKEYTDIDSNIKYLYILVILTAGCGLRISEALAVTIDNINFENNILTISKQQTRLRGLGYGVEYELKTDSGERKVIMIPYISKILKKHLEIIKRENIRVNKLIKDFKFQQVPIFENKKIVGYLDSSNFIIRNSKYNMATKSCVEGSWKKFREKLGYTEVVRIHDFRRFFATLLMTNNVPDKIAMGLLGHSDTDMTRYYQNTNLEIANEYVKNIDLNI